MLDSLFRLVRSTLVVATVLALPAVSLAQSPELNTSTGLTAAGAPLALRGYDPVSYFRADGPELGRAEHQVAFEGATYRFASDDNRRRFEAHPERYLPAFGGFCAYGVSVGKKFDGDPLVWKIVDDRLYLNLNRDIQATWEGDIPGNVAEAERQWRSIHDRDPSDL